MSRPGEGRGLPGRRRGRSAAAGAARGGGPLWPPRSRGGRTAGGADDCHAGLRDDGARRPRRLPRPGDGRRAAREGGERPRGWGGAVRPLPLRRGDAPRQLPVGATTRPLISPAFMFPRRGVVPSGGGGRRLRLPRRGGGEDTGGDSFYVGGGGARRQCISALRCCRK